MRDPYDVLGVSRTASDAEVKRAYRRLAKAHHPDLSPGDRGRADRFREITSAYEILGDSARRAQFDRTGGLHGGAGGRAGGGPWARARRAAGPGGAPFNPEDIFADLFRFRTTAGPGGSGADGAPGKARGADVRVALTLDFRFAILGGSRSVALPSGKRIEVRIPPGTRDGQTLRLRGQGDPNPAGGRAPAGDALIEIRIEPDPDFRRVGDDIHIDLPISLAEAVLGGKVAVATVDGPVMLRIPPGSGGGRPLRLKGRGAPDGKGGRGDQHVGLRIVLPEGPDPELDEFVRRWSKARPYDARK